MSSPDTMPPVLILTMKWGTLYGPEYVNNLARGVARHLSRPHRFICFTDDTTDLIPGIETYPLPQLGLPKGHIDTRWQKLALFSSQLFDLEGTALFLDLDLVILDDLEVFFADNAPFRIIRDDALFRSKPLRALNPKRDRFLASVGNSSVFRYEIGAHNYILENFIAAPELATAQFEISQQYQTAQLAENGHLNYWPDEWCVSFKNSCVPRGIKSYLADPVLPHGARIVVFAGSPKMHDALNGQGSRLHRRIRNVDWLRNAWEAA